MNIHSEGLLGIVARASYDGNSVELVGMSESDNTAQFEWQMFDDQSVRVSIEGTNIFLALVWVEAGTFVVQVSKQVAPAKAFENFVETLNE